jgi:hypothetical protein
MALLKQPYKDVRADMLTTGTGGDQFTDEQIQNYFKTPGITAERAMNDALKYGVNMDRISGAMKDSGVGGDWSTDNIKRFTEQRGVSYDPMAEGQVRVPGSYLDRRAEILSGPGSNTFNQSEFQNLVKSGKSPEHLMNEVLAKGGSLEQVSAAMRNAGHPGDWSVENLKRYTEGRGVGYGTVNDAPYDPVYTPLLNRTAQGTQQRAPFVRAEFDEDRGTVAGRLRQTLDPNNPLMARAQSLAQQQAAKRGMLNTGMAASQGMAAMTDAGLQIATPDANAFNQFALTNAQQENLANQFNAGEGNKMSMFNAGSLNEMTRAQMGIDKDFGLADRATEDLKLRLQNERDIKNLGVEGEFAIQQMKAEQEAAANYGSLSQTYMQQLEAINNNPDYDAETKTRIKDEYVAIMNRAAAMNKYFDDTQLNLDFSSGGSDGGAPAPAAPQPAAGTAQVQTQAQALAQQAEVAPGRYDPNANLINSNGQPLSSLDIRQLNHANQLTGQTISPERVVTSQELIDKSKDPSLGAIGYDRWKRSLDAIIDPSPTSGGPMIYLWPA